MAKSKGTKKKTDAAFLKEEFDFSKAKARSGIDAKQAKVLRSYRIDADIMLWMSTEAEKEALSPNTFLNRLLRQHMEGSLSIEERVSQLEKQMFRNRVG